MLESKLYSLLSGSTSLTAYVGSRIYPLIMPQTPTYPSMVYNRVGTKPVNSVGGTGSLMQISLQIDIYSTDYSVVKTISTVVVSVVGNSTTFKALLVDNMDFIEPEVEAYRVTQTYSIWDYE